MFVCLRGWSLSKGGSLSRWVLCLGLCPRGSLSGGSLSRGGNLCRGRGEGVSAWGSLSGGVFLRGDPHVVNSGRYASYWNVFLLSEVTSAFLLSVILIYFEVSLGFHIIFHLDNQLFPFISVKICPFIFKRW